MSYNIFPQGGRENFLKQKAFSHSLNGTINSGWNHPLRLSTPADPRRSHWGPTPRNNVFPTNPGAMGRPNGPELFRASTASSISSGTSGVLASTMTMSMMPRTPLHSVTPRSEHWYSDPIHGVFSNHVASDTSNWKARRPPLLLALDLTVIQLSSLQHICSSRSRPSLAADEPCCLCAACRHSRSADLRCRPGARRCRRIGQACLLRSRPQLLTPEALLGPRPRRRALTRLRGTAGLHSLRTPPYALRPMCCDWVSIVPRSVVLG